VLVPGAGSVILQALAGGLAGLAVVLKLYWARIKSAFRIGTRSHTVDEQAA
jgi:hypothetical protein